MNARSYPLSDFGVIRLRLPILSGSRNRFINRSGRVIYLAEGQYTTYDDIVKEAFAIILPKSEYEVGAHELEYVSVASSTISFIGKTDDLLTLVTWLPGESGYIIPTSTEVISIQPEDEIVTGTLPINANHVFSSHWDVSKWNSLLIRISFTGSVLPTNSFWECSDDATNWIYVERLRPCLSAYSIVSPQYKYFRLRFFAYRVGGYSVDYRIRMTRQVYANRTYLTPNGIIRENISVSSGGAFQTTFGNRTILYTPDESVCGMIEVPLTAPYNPTQAARYIPFACARHTPWEAVIPAEVGVIYIRRAVPNPATLILQHITDT